MQIKFDSTDFLLNFVDFIFVFLLSSDKSLCFQWHKEFICFIP